MTVPDVTVAVTVVDLTVPVTWPEAVPVTGAAVLLPEETFEIVMMLYSRQKRTSLICTDVAMYRDDREKKEGTFFSDRSITLQGRYGESKRTRNSVVFFPVLQSQTQFYREIVEVPEEQNCQRLLFRL